MKYRPALSSDLPAVQKAFHAIVDGMTAKGLVIWDDVYPFSCLEEDIAKRRLYLLLDGSSIAAVFVLSPEKEGFDQLTWQDNAAPAVYLNRFAVLPAYEGRGTAQLALEKAKETAGALGASFLRLTVVTFNERALHFYQKNGLTKAKGRYKEPVEGASLWEYGFETRL